MKKMLICCSVLCMAFLLFCGSAMAADATIAPASAYSGKVTVTAGTGNDAGTYTVTRSSGVTPGQLYLVLIQKVDDGKGADTPALPTAQNVFYMNVEAASGSSVSMKAFPKELEKGTYVVYLSDYDNDGTAKGVATLTVAGDGSGSILYGDVNGDGAVKNNDAIYLARYLAHWTGYGPGLKYNIVEANADVNGDGSIKNNDSIILARYLAHWTGYDSLPFKR